MRVIVAYDISDDNARAQVAARLAVYGIRIQRSVFDCLIDPRDLDALLTDIRSRMDVRTDVLHVLPTCAACVSGRHVVGQDRHELSTPYWVVF